MRAFIPCRECLNKSKFPGYINITLPNGQEGVKECLCHNTWRKKNELIAKATEANIWHDEFSLMYNPIHDYKGEKSLDSLKKLIYYVDHFNEEEVKTSSLYLVGPNSTQKTHLAQWFGLRLLDKGFSVKYMSMQQFVKLISDFEEREEKDLEVDILKDIDMLILDESFNKEKVTLYKSGFQLPFIETFLKERMENNKKAVMFISNTNIQDIAKNGFSESILQFIKRNIIYKDTLLPFEDNYFINSTILDIKSIFKGME